LLSVLVSHTLTLTKIGTADCVKASLSAVPNPRFPAPLRVKEIER